MLSGGWYRELRGATAYWVASLIFALVGAAFTATGVLVAPFFLLLGIPFLCLGVFILLAMLFSVYLKRVHPERYSIWLWWVNFIGGLFGALLFAVPSTFALPILLLVGTSSETIWIGVLFSAVGAIALVAVVLIGFWQYRKRPR